MFGKIKITSLILIVSMFFLVAMVGANQILDENQFSSPQEQQIICRSYDAFSSGNLNAAKWEEASWHGRPFTDEHYVSSEKEKYHTAQNIEGDAETNLRPKRQFTAGDSFSYDIIYNSGSGNHASQPLINGDYPPAQLEECSYITEGCGVIGYWNANPDLGSQVGKYHINFEFFPSEIKMTAVKPDNSVVVNTFTGNSEPYELIINTHTGHNGLMHIDYDDAIICSKTKSGIIFSKVSMPELPENI